MLTAIGTSLDNIRRLAGAFWSASGMGVPSSAIWLSYLLELAHLVVVPMTICVGVSVADAGATKTKPRSSHSSCRSDSIWYGSYVLAGSLAALGLVSWTTGLGTIKRSDEGGFATADLVVAQEFTALGGVLPGIAGAYAVAACGCVWWHTGAWHAFVVHLVGFIGQAALAAGGSSALFFGSNALEPLFIVGYLLADSAVRDASWLDGVPCIA